MPTLVYWQRKQRLERTFDSLEEAVAFAAIGEVHEELSADEIRDGERVVRGGELDALIFERGEEYERGWGRY